MGPADQGGAGTAGRGVGGIRVLDLPGPGLVARGSAVASRRSVGREAARRLVVVGAVGGGMGGAGGRGWRELSGLPELQEVFEAGEEAREAGHDQGVQRSGQPSATGICQGAGAQAGEAFAQRVRLNIHQQQYYL